MIEKIEDQFLWVEAYRPKKIEDCVLPERLKIPFQEYVKTKTIPNMMLTGSAGVGKTTVAKALCEEIDCDYIVINGSSNRGIDMVRDTIVGYASTKSFKGGRKVVIVDEADYLTDNAQAAFRNYIEQFSTTCSFILTCNYKEKLIEPIHSRCAVIDFQLSKEEKKKMATLFFKRIQEILKSEKVEANEAVVAEIIKKYFPDFRRILNELQRYSKFGKIDVGILSQLSEESVDGVIDNIKNKNFDELKKFIFGNEYESDIFYRKLFNAIYEELTPASAAIMVQILAEYQYKRAFVADKQINDLAFLATTMDNVEFKK